MKEEIGERTFPVWLLGDSEPSQWRAILDFPLDPRHPIRHNIWTSVLDVIQENIYLKIGKRFRSSSIYIRNAVRDVDDKPKDNNIEWSRPTNNHVVNFRAMIEESRPPLILCFGAFAYEFGRRANGEKNQHPFQYWDTKSLGAEFRNKMHYFDVKAVNIIPLLHRSIAGGRFPESHKHFCDNGRGNYFNYVGTELANKIMDIGGVSDIWVKIEGRDKAQE